MTTTTTFAALPVRQAPDSIPCFMVQQIDDRSASVPSQAPRRRRQLWDDRCDLILRLNAQRQTNAAIARLIEAGTGKRFSVFVVSRHRATLGKHAPQYNDWSAALKAAHRVSPPTAAMANDGSPDLAS